MKNIFISRRKMIQIAACTSVTGWGAAQAKDEEFPNRPVRWIVPFTAGGGSDAIARIVSPVAASMLNGFQPVVENRPGGNTVIGSQFVTGSKADGYTIGTINDQLATNQFLLSKLSYSPSDFGIICGLVKIPMLIATRANLPVNNISDLLSYLKSHPGSTYSTWGTGSASHLTTERLADTVGASLTHVPFAGGSPQVLALLAGQVDFAFADIASALQHVGTGRLKVVAVSTKDRIPQLPDVPSISEALPGFEAFVWNAVAAPKGVPKPVMDKLTLAIRSALGQPSVAKDLEAKGMQVWTGSPKEIESQLETDARNSEQIIKKKSIRLS